MDTHARTPSLGEVEAWLRVAINENDEGKISYYSGLMDAAEKHQRATKANVSKLSAALWYAEVGLAVFPLQPLAKTPHRGSHGCLDATTDPDTIRDWWQKTPDSNVGVATGGLVDVIDIDGETGNKSLAELMDLHPNFLDKSLGTVSTPRPGGRHFYLPATGSRGNGAALAAGIDYRGHGGYVVAPPSVTDVGAYTWTVPLRLVRP